MVDVRRKAGAAIVAGLMAVSAVAPAGMVLAASSNNEPSVGADTGTGQTDLNMIIEDVSEHGGTADDPTNANRGDGLGQNLQFTVPSSINFVVKADGTLVAPSDGAAYIENRSNFKTHVTSVKVDEATPNGGSKFNFVGNLETDTASANPTANAVELHFGPVDLSSNSETKPYLDDLNAVSYKTKTAVAHPAHWNMATTNGAHTTTSDRSDEVPLKTSGKVARISNDITAQTKFGQIHWYLTPGQAS